MNYWSGERVRLRPISKEDIEIIASETVNHDYEADRNSYELGFPVSSERIMKNGDGILESNFKNDNFQFSIESLDGEFVGNINTHDTDMRNGTFSFGIYVREEGRGKGYAKEAAILVLRYYFTELRYHKCNQGVYSFNTASQKLHESLGFKHEGVRRECVYSGGKYHDEVLYGMTYDEFVRLSKNIVTVI